MRRPAAVAVAVAVAASLTLGARVLLPAGSGHAATAPVDAEGAVAALSRPSVPFPLAGSTAVGGATYIHPQAPCTAVAAAYQAAGGPVPAGSRVSGDAALLMVDAPFGRSAIFLADGPAGCQYHIAVGPTVRVTGKGPVLPAGDAFVPVGCMFSPVEGLEAAQVTLAGQPVVILLGSANASDASPAPSGAPATPTPTVANLKAGVFRGTFADAAAAGGGPDLSSGGPLVTPDGKAAEYLAAVTEPQPGHAHAVLTGNGADNLVLDMTCTTNVQAVDGQVAHQ